MKISKRWYKILKDPDILEEGKPKIVNAAKKTLVISSVDGKIGVINNACPHTSGPLGEGTIENGFIKCLWHGYEFHTCTGKSPEWRELVLKGINIVLSKNIIYHVSRT